MFTGIIEDLGIVESQRRSREGVVLTIKTALPTAKMKIGDLDLDQRRMHDGRREGARKILRRCIRRIVALHDTRHAQARRPREPGRCMTLGKLLGGHLVAGHVDGLARIVAIKPEGDSRLYTFEAPAPTRAT